MSIDALNFIEQHRIASISAVSDALQQLNTSIAEAAQSMIDCLESGGRVLCCGNGGSASDALHFSAELLNRYKDDRQPLAAIALNADIATITAIANDHHYDQVFAKQVSALGRPGDILLGITSSGNSGNIVEAQHSARKSKLKTILLTGRDGGESVRISGETDLVICVNNDVTAHIQEAHGAIIHCICALIEYHFINTSRS
jgi:phosphoheptose isomerase